MTDIINEEENTTPLPEEEQETVVVDNGQTYESTESAIIAKEEADRAKLWAQESERQANIAIRGAEEAGQAKDDAISAKNDAVAAKEYAEEAVTDVNLITVATDLRATPSNIKTVANNISDVITVSGISSDVTTVANNTTNINTVAGVSSNVTTVATNILNVNNVSNISSDVTTVSGISSDVTAVASNATDISAVAANNTNISAVAANETNINAVNANKTNIDTVAGIVSDVSTVATNNTNVTTVANNVSDINSIATNITNVNTTATNINAINTAATNIVAIQNASVNAQLARDWAVKMDGLVASEDYSAKYYADQARQAAAGAVVDGVTINRNTDDELQAIGVINQNATTTAIKTWTGTKAQYNAITTKDSNTLYHITDDESDIYDRVNSVINRIYPIGSIYLTVSNDNPATLLGLGLWTKVASGRVLQGADNNHIAGTTIEAGLPNIEGDVKICSPWTNASENGALKTTAESASFVSGQSSQTRTNYLYLDASNSNSIYGNSDTVQPPAFAVNIWQRVA